MKSLLRLHRFLGAFSAPMLILFAISGSWQLVNAHKQMKNQPPPPRALHAISDLHMGEDLEGPTKWAYRGVAWLVALSLVVTSTLGLFVAFKVDRSRWIAVAVVSGAVLPLALYLLAHE